MSEIPPIKEQSLFWDQWNLRSRETKLPGPSLRQGEVLKNELAKLGRRDLNCLDVGCGTGWATKILSEYGRATGTDMVEETLNRARKKYPEIIFSCGDFFDISLVPESYDVIVTFEVLAHVADQSAFIARLASLLKPGGMLVLSTQNKPVQSRWSATPSPSPHQLRRWVDHRQLRFLMSKSFGEVKVRSVFPVGDRGYLRILNAPKLNWPFEKLFGKARIERFKESMMLGQTLMAIARRAPF